MIIAIKKSKIVAEKMMVKLETYPIEGFDHTHYIFSTRCVEPALIIFAGVFISLLKKFLVFSVIEFLVDVV
jgi:hypothetical protein